MSTRMPIPLVACLLLASGACSNEAPGESPEAAAAAAEPAPVPLRSSALEAAVALGVPNAHEPAPGLLTSGQITQTQMDALVAAGYKTFVSLRYPTEQGAGWEEAYAAERQTWFVRLAIAGAQDLTRANVEALDQILDAAGGGPVVVYCGSANRVGALLALRARWMDGAPPEDALALGKAAGLTRLEPDVARLLAPTGGTP